MIARFEVSTVRQGNVSPKRFFTATCGECGFQKSFDTNKIDMPLQVVEKAFKRWGWLLGKRPQDHKCPKCMGVRPENKLAEHFKVFEGGKSVPRPREVVEEKADEIFQKREETAQLVSRFFAPAETTFEATRATQPSPEIEETMATQTFRVETGLSLEQTLELSRNLDGLGTSVKSLATEIGDLRAAIEMVMEQNQQLVGAVAQIVPHLTRTADGMFSTVNMAADRITDRLHTSLGEITSQIASTTEAITSAIQPVSAPEAQPPLDRTEAASEVRKIVADIMPEQAQQELLPLTDEEESEDEAPEMETAEVSEPAHSTTVFTPTQTIRVRDRMVSASSSQDSKKPNRFYTQIRIKRDLWDSVGFNEETRPVIYREGRSVMIRAGADGAGVKIKNITAERVILQTSTLGDAGAFLGTDIVAITSKGVITLQARDHHSEAA